MSERKLFFSNLAVVCGDMIFSALAMLFFFQKREVLPTPPFAVWSAAACAGLAGNTLIRRRQGTVNASIFLTAVLGAAAGGGMAVRMAAGEPSFWMSVTVFALGAAPVLHGGILAQDRWKAQRLALYLDGLVLAAGFLMLLDYTGSFSGVKAYIRWTIPVLALAFLMQMVCRTQEAGSFAPVSALLLAGISAAALAAGQFLPGIAAKIVSAAGRLAALLLSVLRALIGALASLVYRLLLLLPLPQEEIRMPEPAQSLPAVPGLPEGPALPGTGVPLLMISVLAVLAGLLVWRRYRGLRWQGSGKKKTLQAGEDRQRIRSGRKKLFRRLLERAVFEGKYLLSRNTPDGLLTYTERKLKKTEQARRSGESAPGFLRRVAAGMDGAGAGSVTLLAETLELAYYAGRKPEAVPGAAAEYRRAFRKSRRDHRRPAGGKPCP